MVYSLVICRICDGLQAVWWSAGMLRGYKDFGRSTGCLMNDRTISLVGACLVVCRSSTAGLFGWLQGFFLTSAAGCCIFHNLCSVFSPETLKPVSVYTGCFRRHQSLPERNSSCIRTVVLVKYLTEQPVPYI